MSLAKRLESAPHPNRGLPCPIDVILRQLSAEDRAALEHQMGLEKGAGGRVTNSALAVALTAEGFPIHYKGVERHRKRVCRCFMGNKR